MKACGIETQLRPEHLSLASFWGGNTSYGEYKLNGFIYGMIASFIATLILELPFFYFAIKDRTKRKIGMKRFIEANSISNIIMFLIYFLIVFGGRE
jgi:hypothetical protein